MGSKSCRSSRGGHGLDQLLGFSRSSCAFRRLQRFGLRTRQRPRGPRQVSTGEKRMDESGVKDRTLSPTAARAGAVAHVWPHSAELDWDELSAGEGLKVFAKGEGCVLTDVS